MSEINGDTNQAFIHSPNLGLTAFKHVLKPGLSLLHHTIACYLQLLLHAVCLPAVVRYRRVYRLASHVLARLSCVAVSERCSSLKTGIVTEDGILCSNKQKYR